jgi:opacity protein-like surface antigen
MKLQAVVLIVYLFSPVVVSAAETEIYVGASLGEKVSFIMPVYRPGSEVEDQSFSLFGGIDIGEYFAVELAYHDLGRRYCCWYGAADIGGGLDLDGYSASVIAKVPVRRFDLFAKVGYLFWDHSGNVLSIEGPVPFFDDGSDLMLGVGVDFNLTDHFALRAQWEYFGIDPEPLFYLDEHGDAFSLGICYSF